GPWGGGIAPSPAPARTRAPGASALQSSSAGRSSRLLLVPADRNAALRKITTTPAGTPGDRTHRPRGQGLSILCHCAHAPAKLRHEDEEGMMGRRGRIGGRCISFVAAALTTILVGARRAEADGPAFPGATWTSKPPETLGLDPRGLREFREFVGGRG